MDGKVSIETFVKAWGQFNKRIYHQEKEPMKITEIKIQRRKNLGSYEHLELGFTAAIDEGETPTEAIDRVKKLLDWEINREERDATRAKHVKWLAWYEEQNEEAKAAGLAEKGRIEKWLTRYDELKAEVEQLA